MPFKNTAITMCISVWNTNSGNFQTGDSANITVRGVGDGSEYTPAAPNVTEMDATNLPGIYKVSLAAGENNYSIVLLGGKSSTAACVVQPVQWTNEMNSNQVQILGTSVSTPATAGILDVNVKNIDNDAASASGTVTFPNATLASTTNITAGTITTVGTLTTYTGNTIQTGDSFARIGVAGAGLTNIDLPDQTMNIVGNITGNLSGSVGSVTGNVGGSVASVVGAVGSVTGAVGSVTGNVGGNVTGSVGSVVGAVGSVTGAVGSVAGNVGGNVVGTVASVVGAVGSVTGNVGGNVTGSVASVVGNIGGNVVGSVASVTAPVSIAASQIFIKKNSILTGFQFVMTDSTTHIPLAGLTVTATRSIDGGAFGACANAVIEIANGWYKITLAATDTNGTTIALSFTATDADDRNLTLVTQA